ncbi:MAG: sigma-54 dependent transcriptional regulator [Firmicutes bacterium]|nr:sigma-54 dependent transcriptional regulator [Bacillota bacterium]
MKKKVLIIDDEISICSTLSFALKDKYDVRMAIEPYDAIKILQNEFINICLLDLRLGGHDGNELLIKIKEMDPTIIVIIMTAYASIDTSVEAIRRGAYTYLAKPLNLGELFLVLEQAIEYQQLNEKVEYLNKEIEKKYVYNGIIGRSPQMKNIYMMIEKLKNVDTSVMILGESGTGKEIIAKALHYSGKRKNEKFVGVNCAAIPETLLEGELFGYKKGAFTGAVADMKGKFEVANKGTLFLDEIGDMTLSLQAKLLRVLQEKEFTPLGSNEKRNFDIRVLAATNKDITSLVEKGSFRQDLYFRINVVQIHIPPLRERKQDLRLLINHFIGLHNKELGKHIKGMSKEAQRKLLDYSYPGNVRELSNILEYAMVLTDDETIEADDLPQEVSYYQKNRVGHSESVFKEDLLGLSLKKIEAKIIHATLINNNGHRQKTAKMLGISERGLRNKIKEYDINI